MDLLCFKKFSPYFSSTEQEVDGETLKIMTNCATTEQLDVCGLKTIKDQMKLQRVFGILTSGETSWRPSASSIAGFGSTSGSNFSATNTHHRKRTLSKV